MRTNPMKQTLNIAILLAMTLLASACGSRQESSPFVRVEGGSFIRNSRPYSYIGTNFWYGPILASEGEGGNYDRLVRELDTLQSLGVENLRVLVGGDGPDGVFSRIEPTLQKEPGVYNDTILTGLDRFLEELGKRNMQAVLYLNNSWEWSGGYGQYLEWAGAGKALIPLVDGYAPFMAQMAQFSVNRKAQELFFRHLETIVGRTNSRTGKPYREDPAIFAWQIGNEPRCFSSDPAVQDGFIGWLTEAAKRIKAIDPNHLVSVGSEGLWGCENDMALLERVTAIPDVDYMTIHIWPYNWSWAHADRLVEEDTGSPSSWRSSASPGTASRPKGRPRPRAVTPITVTCSPRWGKRSTAPISGAGAVSPGLPMSSGSAEMIIPATRPRRPRA